MHKKYIVRLSRKERQQLNSTVESLKGSSQKARRARIMLKADTKASSFLSWSPLQAEGDGRTTSAKRLKTNASIGSVLALRPIPRAKSRT